MQPTITVTVGVIVLLEAHVRVSTSRYLKNQSNDAQKCEGPQRGEPSVLGVMNAPCKGEGQQAGVRAAKKARSGVSLPNSTNV